MPAVNVNLPDVCGVYRFETTTSRWMSKVDNRYRTTVTVVLRGLRSDLSPVAGVGIATAPTGRREDVQRAAEEAADKVLGRWSETLTAWAERDEQEAAEGGFLAARAEVYRTFVEGGEAAEVLGTLLWDGADILTAVGCAKALVGA